MDKRTEYREIIRRILCDYEQLYNRKPSPNVETSLVYDAEHDHYALMSLGWKGEKRVRQAILYLRLRNGKIWIEEDWTQDGVVMDLLDAGVPKEDIVLAFNPPEVRHLTEYAVA
jgi:hypothetical protein